MAPLMLQASAHGGIRARAAAASSSCSNILGSGWTNTDHCASTIKNSNNGYCLSSYGQGQGAAVREFTCNSGSANQIWWMANSGVNGTWEIWNVGSSCPSSLAWDSCGEPFGSATGYGYGYCIDVKGLNAGNNVPLIMWGCKNGNVAAMSFHGLGTSWHSASIVYNGNGGNHYCISSLGNASDGSGYALFTCNYNGNQTFSAPTFSSGSITGGPPAGGGPPPAG